MKKAAIFEDDDFEKFRDLPDPENKLMREKVASIFGRFGSSRPCDYAVLHYNKEIKECKGTAYIKVFEKGMFYFLFFIACISFDL